ncbi:MAG: IPT/TIG domain-containing protein, partial [bacterium]
MAAPSNTLTRAIFSTTSVAAGQTGTLSLSQRANIEGDLVGDGTLNVVAPSTTGGTRNYLRGRAQNFSGNINISGGGRLDLAINFNPTRLTGFDNSNLTINGESIATMGWSVASGGTYVNIGSLSGNSSAVLYGASNAGADVVRYQVGAKNIDTTFAGVIADAISPGVSKTLLTKGGTGILTLSGANTYSGTTTINTGILQIGDGGTTGTLGSGTTTNNSILVFNRSNDMTVNSAISGTGVLKKLGLATTTLSSIAVNYTGDTNVATGTLAFTAAVPPSANWNLSITDSSTYSKITLPASPNLSGKTINIQTTASDIGYSRTLVSWTGTAVGTLTLKLNGATVTSGQTVNGTTITYSASSGVTFTRSGPAPTISSVVPSYVLATGADSVTITGTGFSNPTIKFGGVSGTVASSNSTTISATTPVHAIGAVDILVTNSDGQTATLSGALTYVSGLACDLGSLAGTCTISTTHTISNGDVIAGSGNLVIANGGILTSAAGNKFGINMGGDITVQSGGQILGNLSGATSTNFTIDLGGLVSATGKGYAAGTGPGKGGSYSTGGGGGYGGNGGREPNANNGGSTYGFVKTPVDFGSGGGVSSDESAGGGLLKFVTSGTMAINGAVVSNGANGKYYTGGSGGSIWIQTNTLSGNGSTTANGGNGNLLNGMVGGGGGGGRIAIYYTNDSSSLTKQSYGGAPGSASAMYGGAGTIYTKSSSATNGDLIVNNNGITGSNTTQTAASTITLDNLTVKNKAYYIVPSGAVLNIATNIINSTTDASITNNGTMSLPSVLTNFNLTNAGTLNIPQDINIGSGVILTEANNKILTVVGDLVISNGGVLASATGDIFGINVGGDIAV